MSNKNEELSNSTENKQSNSEMYVADFSSIENKQHDDLDSAMFLEERQELENKRLKKLGFFLGIVVLYILFSLFSPYRGTELKKDFADFTSVKMKEIPMFAETDKEGNEVKETKDK